MSASGPALLAAAAGVGFGHAILPDHWVPLAVLGRIRRYPLSRVARLSSLAGVAHVFVSIALGAVTIAIGLQFRSTIQHVQHTIIGCILVATGIAFFALDLAGHGHRHDHKHDHHHAHNNDHVGEHDHHGHGHRHASGRAGGSLDGLAGVMVPFGAAASPDLTILPVFLASTTGGIARSRIADHLCRRHDRHDCWVDPHHRPRRLSDPR